MIKYDKPYLTIGDLIKDKDYDYVSYRISFPHEEKGIFAGCFKTNNGKIISLDGDVYDLNEKVIASEEWENSEADVKNGLTIIVENEDEISQ